MLSISECSDTSGSSEWARTQCIRAHVFKTNDVVSKRCKYADFLFAEKQCKSYSHFFSAKNIRILYIESAKTVNEMTLNELVKLTTL